MNLQSELQSFTGTEHWYLQVPSLGARVTYTDGVKYFAEKAGAFWLLDILATELTEFVRENGIVFVTATVKNSKASIAAVRDKGLPPLWTRHVDFTDLPEGEWQLWIGEGGPDGSQVIMLPSEY